jgi:predicted oxidoreductase (fatty acid repression mutant protein)
MFFASVSRRAGIGLLICFGGPHAIIEPMAYKAKATRPSTADRAAEQADYRTWKARAVAELGAAVQHASDHHNKGVEAAVVQGLTPEDGVKQSDAHHYNTPPALDRLRRR